MNKFQHSAHRVLLIGERCVKVTDLKKKKKNLVHYTVKERIVMHNIHNAPPPLHKIGITQIYL